MGLEEFEVKMLNTQASTTAMLALDALQTLEKAHEVQPLYGH